MSVTHTLSRTTFLSGNPIPITVTANETPTGSTNHKLLMKVSCADLFSTVQVDERDPIALVANFNISGLVNEPISSEFQWPVVGVASAHAALMLTVTIDIGESWTDTDGIYQESWEEIVSDNTLYIINGFLRDYEIGIENDSLTNFATEFITAGKFLTRLANNMVVSPNQYVKLWFLSRWAENHNCTLNIVVENSTGEDFEFSQEVVLYTITGLLELTFNPALIGFFDNNPSGTLALAYSVWLEDIDGPVSEIRRFVVNNKYYEKSFFCFARNQFSCIDSYWFHGSTLEKLKTESETAVKPIPVGSGSKVAGVVTVSSGSQRSWKINTGVIASREQRQALRNLLDSPECWIINPDDATKLIPVRINAGDFTIDDSMAAVQSIEVEIYEAYS